MIARDTLRKIESIIEKDDVNALAALPEKIGVAPERLPYLAISKEPIPFSAYAIRCEADACIDWLLAHDEEFGHRYDEGDNAACTLAGCALKTRHPFWYLNKLVAHGWSPVSKLQDFRLHKHVWRKRNDTRFMDQFPCAIVNRQNDEPIDAATLDQFLHFVDRCGADKPEDQYDPAEIRYWMFVTAAASGNRTNLRHLAERGVLPLWQGENLVIPAMMARGQFDRSIIDDLKRAGASLTDPSGCDAYSYVLSTVVSEWPVDDLPAFLHDHHIRPVDILAGPDNKGEPFRRLVNAYVEACREGTSQSRVILDRIETVAGFLREIPAHHLVHAAEKPNAGFLLHKLLNTGKVAYENGNNDQSEIVDAAIRSGDPGNVEALIAQGFPVIDRSYDLWYKRGWADDGQHEAVDVFTYADEVSDDPERMKEYLARLEEVSTPNDQQTVDRTECPSPGNRPF